jgi:hypothetical protein
MNEYKSVIIGIALEGGSPYWAGALATAISFLKRGQGKIDGIRICTTQVNEYRDFSKAIKSIFGEKYRTDLIIPDRAYGEFCPSYNGSYAPYWKLDLFRSLSSGEVLLSVDCDAFAIRPFETAVFTEIFNNTAYKIAGVPSMRPVLERWLTLGLNNPYDYINGGVLVGVASEKYEIRNIRDTVRNINQRDLLSLIWADQDIINALFVGEIYKIEPIYNISTGYLLCQYHSPFQINSVLRDAIIDKGVIAHLSGGFAFNSRFHPLKHYYSDLLSEILDSTGDTTLRLSGDDFPWLRAELETLLAYARNIRFDYLLQLLRIKKRIFYDECYLGPRELLGVLKKIFTLGPNNK